MDYSALFETVLSWPWQTILLVLAVGYLANITSLLSRIFDQLVRISVYSEDIRSHLGNIEEGVSDADWESQQRLHMLADIRDRLPRAPMPHDMDP